MFSCFFLSFRFKIRKNPFNKTRNRSPQLFFQQPLHFSMPLLSSGDLYVKLLIMNNTRELNFLCNFTFFTQMGNKNNPEQSP